MVFRVVNAKSFAAGLDQIIPRFKKKLGQRLDRIVREAHRSLLDKTPVHTGKTIRNYIVSMNTPVTNTFAAIGDGFPGPTNQLSLGAESRRSANAAASMATLGSVNFKNPFQIAYISNTSEAIQGLEFGSLPSGEGKQQRSPQGMFAVTLEVISAKVAAGAL